MGNIEKKRLERKAYGELLKKLRNGLSIQEAADYAAKDLPLSVITHQDQNIVAIIPISMPDSEPRSLVICDKLAKLVAGKSRQCMEETMKIFHGIKNTKSYRKSISYLLEENRYKVPYATEYFTMTALESADNSICVSVQRIKDIKYGDSGSTIFLDNRLVIKTVSKKRAIERELRLAYQTSVFLRCDHSPHRFEAHRIPLDQFIDVPIANYNHKILENLDKNRRLPKQTSFTELYYKHLYQPYGDDLG